MVELHLVYTTADLSISTTWYSQSKYTRIPNHSGGWWYILQNWKIRVSRNPTNDISKFKVGDHFTTQPDTNK